MSKLHSAVVANDRAAVRSQLSRGAKLTYCPDELSYTALHEAAARGHDRLIPLFIQRHANLDLVTASGHTPLALACMNGHADAAELLVKAGASLDVATSGMTAQDLANKHTSWEQDQLAEWAKPPPKPPPLEELRPTVPPPLRRVGRGAPSDMLDKELWAAATRDFEVGWLVVLVRSTTYVYL